MSTEHKNELETNALADRLGRGWEQFKQGKLISYRVMALILLLGTAIGVYFYIRAEQVTAASKAWIELEGANSVSSLEAFPKDHPNTSAAKVAQLQLARYLLGPDGIEKLTSREEGERKKAVENVEKSRDIMASLLDEFKDDPGLKADCYCGLAKAETALVGVPKEGSTTEFRGSVDKVTEWLDKLAEAAPGTPWGDDAKKESESLKTNPRAKGELTTVQRNMYKQEPPIPGLGGQPPIGGPFPSAPGIPGVPGGPFGGPLAPGPTPPTPPSLVPPPPMVAPPPPTGTAPIPPAVAPLTPTGQPSNPTPAPRGPVAPPMTPPTPGTTTPPVAPPAAPPTPPVPPKK
ncbi:MAG: hypothetical protein JWO38_7655 [Gemmataceae bacterium]|nr:hypothetical protein [Gemmataceae bacterium]